MVIFSPRNIAAQLFCVNNDKIDVVWHVKVHSKVLFRQPAGRIPHVIFT